MLNRENSVKFYFFFKLSGGSAIIVMIVVLNEEIVFCAANDYKWVPLVLKNNDGHRKSISLFLFPLRKDDLDEYFYIYYST